MDWTDCLTMEELNFNPVIKLECNFLNNFDFFFESDLKIKNILINIKEQIVNIKGKLNKKVLLSIQKINETPINKNATKIEIPKINIKDFSKKLKLFNLKDNDSILVFNEISVLISMIITFWFWDYKIIRKKVK